MLFVLGTPHRLFAQIDAGEITGTVHDKTGAVVVKAQVALTNEATGVKNEAQSTSTGTYVFDAVKPGSYTIEATAPNFEKFTSHGILVHVQQTSTVDIGLSTGNVQEVVTVTASDQLLQTENGEVGQTIETKMVNELPLNGRNWLSLGQLSAGVGIPATSAPSNVGSSYTGGAESTFYSANGANLWQNDVRLNGINNNVEVFGGSYAGSDAAVNPPPDGIQEFRMESGNYNAEFGHSTGAVIDAVTKSGTNALHGDLWEYFRNEDLDSNNYFSLLNHVAKSEYRQNEFGGTIGGPVLVPKIYNGRNKTFFFFDYQGNKITTPAPFTGTVPTMGMKNSGFSNLQDLIAMNSGTHADALGRIFPNGTILDPATTRSVAGSALDPVTGLTNPTASTIYVRDPFFSGGSVGNIANFTGMASQLNMLPQNRMDPNALKLLSLYPNPTNLTTFTNNYYYTPKNTIDVKQYDVRIDESLRDKDSFFAVFDKSYFDEVTPGHLAGPAIGQSGAQNQHFPAYMISGGYIHAFTPTLFNEIHVGFNHSNKNQITFDGGQYGIPAEYGIQGIPQVGENGGLTPVSIGGLTGVGESGNRPTLQTVYDTEATENVTKIFGAHDLRFGFQMDDIHGNITQPASSRGAFSYSGQFSDVPNKSTGLNGLADILLSPAAATVANGINNVGGITQYSGNPYAGSDYQRWFEGAYFQDNWKATRSLTLNLGLRWDFFAPYGDTNGHQANFIPAGGNGFAAGSTTGSGTYYIASKGCQVARSVGFNTLLTANNINLVCNSGTRTGDAQTTNFAPRVGFAYRVNNSIAVRGGYGITYGALANLGYNGTLGTNYPFVYSLGNSAPNSQTPLVLSNGQTATMENTFATISLTDPTVVTGAGASLNLFGRQWNYQSPYTQSYNLTVQDQFSKHDSISVAYVGTLGRHLDVLNNTNMANQFQAPGANPVNFVAFPGFARGSTYETTNAMSSYNSMQATFEHHMSYGLTVLANYTFSKCLTDQRSPQSSAAAGYRAPWLQGFGIGGDYGLCDADSTHVTHLSGTYKLPIGRGMMIGTNMNRALDAVAGGWQFNWIYTFQTGQPFTISCPTATTAFYGCYATKVAGTDIYAGQHNRKGWLNPAAFAQPTPATAGTSMSTALLGGDPGQARGPHYNNLDASMFKEVSFTDQVRFQFRLETFNTFNLAQFAQPTNLNFNNPSNFSAITGLRGDARKVQLAAKILF
jgi:hypothetical protein